MKTSEMTTSEVNDARRTALGFCAVFGLALALRIYRLGEESIYYDEYSSLVFINAPSLLDFLRLNRVHDPAMAPAYFILQYFWYHFISPSWYGLRLASVAVGLGVVGVAYAAGRDFAGGGAAGRRAGLLAALFVALSPSHIYFAQEIKNYGLFTLSAAFAAWTLLRATRGDGAKWWIGNAVANIVLIWSHLYGSLFLVPEGLYLLSFGFCHWRRWLSWGMAHFMIVLPLVYFISTMTFPEAKSANWLGVPSKTQLTYDVLADDVVRALNPAARQTETWEKVMSPEAAQTLVGSLTPWIGPLIPLLTVAGVIAALWITSRRRATRDVLLLVFWFAFPPLTLYALTVWWRPCMVPRYTLPASLGVYWIMGIALAGITRRQWRNALFAFLAVLSAWQLTLQYDHPNRENWQGVGRLLESRAKPTDLVLVNNDLWAKILMFCMKSHPYQTEGIVSSEDASDRILLYPEIAGFRGIGPDVPLTAWAVIPVPFQMLAIIFRPSAGLDRNGIKYEQFLFPGARHIYVYRVDCPPAGTPPPPEVLARLKPDQANIYVTLARELLVKREFEKAIRAANRAAEVNPGLGDAWQLLAMARQGQNDTTGALEAYQKAIACMPDNPWVKVAASLLRFEQNDFAGPLDMLRDAAAKLPQDPLARYAFGVALAGTAQTDAGIAELKESLTLRPDDVTALLSLIAVCRERGLPEDIKAADDLMTTHSAQTEPYRAVMDAMYVAKDAARIRQEMDVLPTKGLGLPPLVRWFAEKRTLP